MIHIAIDHIADQLNQYLKRSFNLHEDIVVTSSLVELDGTIAPQTNKRIIICLVNVEKDTAPRQSPGGTTDSGAYRVQNVQPLYLNLYLMIAGHFARNNYTEALKRVKRGHLTETRKLIRGHPTTETMLMK